MSRRFPSIFGRLLGGGLVLLGLSLGSPLSGQEEPPEPKEYLELELDGRIYRVEAGEPVRLPCPHADGEELVVRVGPSLFKEYQGPLFRFTHPAGAAPVETELDAGFGRAVSFKDPSEATVLISVLDELKGGSKLREQVAHRIIKAYSGRGVEVERVMEPAVYFPGRTEPGTQLRLDQDLPQRVEIHVLPLESQHKTITIIIRIPLAGPRADRAELVRERFRKSFELTPPPSADETPSPDKGERPKED